VLLAEGSGGSPPLLHTRRRSSIDAARAQALAGPKQSASPPTLPKAKSSEGAGRNSASAATPARASLA
jgi:hypothetical protein